MNTYTIQTNIDALYPFAIVSGQTQLSSHSTLEEAEKVQAKYYAGDKYFDKVSSLVVLEFSS